MPIVHALRAFMPLVPCKWAWYGLPHLAACGPSAPILPSTRLSALHHIIWTPIDLIYVHLFQLQIIIGKKTSLNHNQPNSFINSCLAFSIIMHCPNELSFATPSIICMLANHPFLWTMHNSILFIMLKMRYIPEILPQKNVYTIQVVGATYFV